MSADKKVQFPILKWAQRKDKLYITINVVHSKPPTVDIIEDGKKLKYAGTDGENNYAFEIELFDEVTKEESKYNLAARNIFLTIHKKKTTEPFWPRLIKDTKKSQWIQVDWAYFVEEDEEDEGVKPPMGDTGADLGDLGEMDEDDEVPGEDHNCNCGHDHEKCEHDDNKKEEPKTEEPKAEEPKKADLSDLDKEEAK